ncbi:NurA 5'-3' nuclease [Halanaeroarchaeum sp. HSR-CO]|uniref:DNA double-strand break repair nuclease NurA n=1 Tax=Halanaeroarchaeum sp. HSR-CO TaxID=2866382 RepID=UPI00217E0875|nr:DNA double-strand break repair nuclease NurA [Halanaeroarchaeum sp. HSR-CO]UWG48828.1 NurA 5'-3' nuclease [Halanaeroarchaeum sp. HSR-CO]
MTLDPVHYDGIATLAERIRHDTDPEEQRDVAEAVWAEFLDPLYGDAGAVLEPIDDQRRRTAPIDDLALRDPVFDSVHGIDSGTINPTTFKNGLLVDLAQAAMSATPSALDVHRKRTYIMTVYSNDATVDHGMDEWTAFDAGHGRGRVVHTAALARDQERVVHGLALYLAESHHALENADRVDDLLVLDGPLYPKQTVHWLDRHGTLADLVSEDDLVEEVVANYLRLVERFVERDVPLVGFVKSPQSQALIRTVRERGRPTPWATDSAFFARVLERRERHGDTFERVRDELTWTNWFRSRLGADGVFSGENRDIGVDRRLDPPAYEVVFFVVYDPRTDLVFKVELPAAFAERPAVRNAVERWAVGAVAAERGPPGPVAKADELARIDRGQKRELTRRLERGFDTEVDTNYDRERWGI